MNFKLRGIIKYCWSSPLNRVSTFPSQQEQKLLQVPSASLCSTMNRLDNLIDHGFGVLRTFESCVQPRSFMRFR